jgi:hypothetical protein
LGLEKLKKVKELIKPLNIFYSEPDPDRWFKFDRYPRKIVRRILRGKERPGGVMLVAINLMKGLDRLNIPYRFNDYKYIKKHPEELACIIGKPHLLFDRDWKNPVILGAGIFSHPLGHENIFKKYDNLKLILVPGEWMRKMFEPYYGLNVKAWPVGIDTEYWKPQTDAKILYDFLIYDKLRWEYDSHLLQLIEPIHDILKKNNKTFETIKYGKYEPDELKKKAISASAIIFLCQHETQGQAYQQILSLNKPILAWDPREYWTDPAYFPKKIKYGPVSSVPYWDDRCGFKFVDKNEFESKLKLFMHDLNSLEPRNFILENLTLEKCANDYLHIVRELEKKIQIDL